MEIFIPGVAILLLIAVIIFLVLPRFGAPMLAVISLLLLGYGLYNHMSMFYSEYQYSTWQFKLQNYAPFLIVGAVILFLLGYMGFLFGSGAGNTLPASNLPAITNVLNVTKANSSRSGSPTIAEQITNAGNAVGTAVRQPIISPFPIAKPHSSLYPYR